MCVWVALAFLWEADVTHNNELRIQNGNFFNDTEDVQEVLEASAEMAQGRCTTQGQQNRSYGRRGLRYKDERLLKGK